MTGPTHQTTIQWLQRPMPFADESLAGFLSRWARENELTSRSHLLSSFEVSRAIRLPHVELPRLAAVLGLEPASLKAIAPAIEPPRAVLRRAHTRPDTEAICPQCLSGASYSRQLWSHCLATACPEHGTRLLDHCRHCGEGVRHNRPLPHLCDCGADLRLQATAPATQTEVDFSALLMGDTPQGASLPFFLVVRSIKTNTK